MKKTTERTEDTEKSGYALCSLRTLWLMIHGLLPVFPIFYCCSGFREAPHFNEYKFINIWLFGGMLISETQVF